MTTSSTSRVALLAASTVLFAGCASILSGKRQALALDSDPPGATASFGGQAVDTPGALVVLRKTEGIRIRFEKPGYAACALTLEREKDGAYWANLALIPVGIAAGAVIGNAACEPRGWFDFTGGIVGAAVGGVILPLGAMGIDKGSGAAYQHRPGKVTVLLARSESGLADAPTGQEPACAVAGKGRPKAERPATPTVDFVPGPATGGVKASW